MEFLARKTESAKIILEYYNNFNNDEISKLILDSIPVLEVFGNAKIIRNENSSKFTEINNWLKNFKLYEEEKDILFPFKEVIYWNKK